VKLTRAGEYAVRCVLYLACQPPGQVASSRQVAKAMDIPQQFLGKIAQVLARAGVLEIVQGARGGLRLARPAREITLLDVVEAADGELALNQCLLRSDSCGRSSMCAVHRIWGQARQALRDVLASADFAALAAQEIKAQKRIAAIEGGHHRPGLKAAAGRKKGRNLWMC
jgi:Rrf2 family protein